MEQWPLLENISWKTIFKPRVVWQKKRIKITCDQEFDEIEDRRKNIGERIDDRKDTRKIQ